MVPKHTLCPASCSRCAALATPLSVPLLVLVVLLSLHLSRFVFRHVCLSSLTEFLSVPAHFSLLHAAGSRIIYLQVPSLHLQRSLSLPQRSIASSMELLRPHLQEHSRASVLDQLVPSTCVKPRRGARSSAASGPGRQEYLSKAGAHGPLLQRHNQTRTDALSAPCRRNAHPVQLHCESVVRHSTDAANVVFATLRVRTSRDEKVTARLSGAVAAVYIVHVRCPVRTKPSDHPLAVLFTVAAPRPARPAI
eukprot:SAG31_NODE_2227_length_6148_cov_5.268309_7_plen_250_part_00